MKLLTITLPKDQFYNTLNKKENIVINGNWIIGKLIDRKGKIKPFTHLRVKLTSWNSPFYFIANIEEIQRLEDVQNLALKYEPSFLFRVGLINDFDYERALAENRKK